MLFELGLEALEQREGVCRGTGESRQHAFVIQPAHLPRRGFEHDVAERDLPVPAQGHRAVAAHRQYGRTVKLFQIFLKAKCGLVKSGL